MPGKVILGEFTFEIGPRNQIDYTGSRSIVSLDIPGTAPKYQDMGEGEHTIVWAGVLEGNSAQVDCQKIEQIRKAGREISYITDTYNKTVRIKEFNHSDVREDYIAYSITLVEIQHQVLKEKTKASAVVAPSLVGNAVVAVSSLKKYTVAKGDTLYGIAQKLLKDGNRWQEIAKDNKITNPRKLQTGQVLVINTGGGATIV